LELNRLINSYQKLSNEKNLDYLEKENKLLDLKQEITNLLDINNIEDLILIAKNKKSATIQVLILELLKNFDDEKSKELVIKKLKSKNVQIRAEAIKTLDSFEGDFTNYLLKALEDEDEEVRGNALNGLHNIDESLLSKHRKIIEKTLIKALKIEEYFENGSFIAEILWDLKGIKLTSLFLDILKSGDEGGRYGAASILRRAEKKLVFDQLLYSSVNDESEIVRGESISSLNVFGGEKVFKMLCNSLLSDESVNVREQIAEILGDLQDTRAVPYLIKALENDTEGAVRASAAINLGYIGDESAIKPLIYASQYDSDIVVKCDASHALGYFMDSNNAINHLIKLLNKTREPGLRVFIIQALNWNIDNEKVVDTIVNFILKEKYHHPHFQLMHAIKKRDDESRNKIVANHLISLLKKEVNKNINSKKCTLIINLIYKNYIYNLSDTQIDFLFSTILEIKNPSMMFDFGYLFSSLSYHIYSMKLFGEINFPENLMNEFTKAFFNLEKANVECVNIELAELDNKLSLSIKYLIEAENHFKEILLKNNEKTNDGIELNLDTLRFDLALCNFRKEFLIILKDIQNENLENRYLRNKLDILSNGFLELFEGKEGENVNYIDDSFILLVYRNICISLKNFIDGTDFEEIKKSIDEAIYYLTKSKRNYLHDKLDFILKAIQSFNPREKNYDNIVYSYAQFTMPKPYCKMSYKDFYLNNLEVSIENANKDSHEIYNLKMDYRYNLLVQFELIDWPKNFPIVKFYLNELNNDYEININPELKTFKKLFPDYFILELEKNKILHNERENNVIKKFTTKGYINFCFNIPNNGTLEYEIRPVFVNGTNFIYPVLINNKNKIRINLVDYLNTVLELRSEILCILSDLKIDSEIILINKPEEDLIELIKAVQEMIEKITENKDQYDDDILDNYMKLYERISFITLHQAILQNLSQNKKQRMIKKIKESIAFVNKRLIIIGISKTVDFIIKNLVNHIPDLAQFI